MHCRGMSRITKNDGLFARWIFEWFGEFTFFARAAGGVLGAIDQQAAARGAFFARRLAPVGIFTVRVLVASKKCLALAAALLDNFAFAASRTRYPRAFLDFFNVFAIRVARAT